MSAAEMERDAPALEIQVRWGESLLLVRHFAPPRSFVVGDVPCDFPLPEGLLGAARIPIALVERGVVSALLPPGAACAPEAREAGEEPWPGAPACRRLTLKPGERASIALRAAGGAAGYRAPAAGDGEALLVIELALVNAGRPVGRGLSLRRAGRPLAAISAAAIGALAALGSLSLAPPPDEDAREEERAERIGVALAVLAAREAEEKETEQVVEPLGQAMDPPPLRLPEGIAPRWEKAQGQPETPLNALEDEEIAALAQIQPRVRQGLCFDGLGLELWGFHARGSWVSDVRTPFAPICGAVRDGPFAMRGVGTPPPHPEATGGEPSRLWYLGYRIVAEDMGVAPWDARLPPAQLIRRDLRGPLPGAAADRLVRGRLRAARMCYRLRSPALPDPAGSVDVRLVVGSDGLAPRAAKAYAALRDPRVVECVIRAFDGIRFPSFGHASSLTYRIELGSTLRGGG